MRSLKRAFNKVKTANNLAYKHPSASPCLEPSVRYLTTSAQTINIYLLIYCLTFKYRGEKKETSVQKHNDVIKVKYDLINYPREKTRDLITVVCGKNAGAADASVCRLQRRHVGALN